MATPELRDLFVTRKLDRILFLQLETYLTTINVVLYDAEYRQIALTDQSVKGFLNTLRDVAYEADDLFDLIAYEVTAKKISTKTKKIEEIVKMLEILIKQIDPLGLKKNQTKDALPQREPTSSVVDEYEIFGRDSEVNDLLSLLEVSDKNDIGVIPIIGMGGIGKTTLVRIVYNHSKAKELFGTRAWVCVSDNYDGSRIRKELLQQVNTSGKCEKLSPQQIDEELKKCLESKKYLIVLDDVWDNQYNNWSKLQETLNSGANGSKILVTTRF